MSKIAIISQSEKGVLIDVSGCSSLQEATHHLTSTLQISSEFWKGMNVDLNLGDLSLDAGELAQILAIAREVGIKPNHVFARAQTTREALNEQMPACGVDRHEASSKPAGTEEVRQCQTVVAASEVQAGAETAPGSGCISLQERQVVSTGAGSTAGSAAAGACQVLPPAQATLHLRQTLRSGQMVRHSGHLVIVGDVNAGAEVVADGDITVWGALRGVAHAGVNGDTGAEIRALRLEPIQLRIAQAIARSPDRPRKPARAAGPETARVVNGSIRITANNPD